VRHDRIWGFDNNTSKEILNLLETVYLTLRETSEGSNGTSCFEIKITDEYNDFTNMRITRFRQCGDLVRESETFIKDEAKIVSRVNGIKGDVVYFSKLLFVTNEEKFCFRGGKSQETGSHP